MDALARSPRRPQPQGADLSAFATDVLAGLGTTPKRVPAKYFYDETGSRLFEQITEVPEYYPTRSEMQALRDHAAEIAALIPAGAALVEFGSGSTKKARIVLNAARPLAAYVPVDISGEMLAREAAELRADHPRLKVLPVVADFCFPFDLPREAKAAPERVGFFPGSTIGNFTPQEALQFLAVAAQVLRGGALLLGADLVKDPAILHAAYNDAQGVTADFNLNLLARANRELGTDFALDRFFHSAFYNAPRQRIEMHLVSRCRQQVVLGERAFELEEGESLRTEYSHKYTIAGLRDLALRAGFRPGPVWTDEQRLFSVHWLQAPQEGKDA